MIQRTTSILLLFALLINIAGFYPVFKWEQWVVQKEIKRRIKSNVPYNELHVIRLQKDHPLSWVKQDKEFILNDQMFDIVRKESTSDSTTYFCINDKQEKQLFAQLEQLTNDQMNNPEKKDQPVKNLFKIFNSLVFLLSQQHKFHLASSSNDLSINKTSEYSDVLLSEDSPPPEFHV